jgi:DNA-binding transcriptional ArsR family regulator
MATNLFQGPFLAIPVWAVDVITEYGQPRDLQVLVALVSLMDRRNREVTASVTQISDHLGVSRETVKRSLRWLSEYGIITTRKRTNPTINVYTVHYTDAGMGSRVSHTRVMGEPPLGSPVSHPEVVTRVTGDPSSEPKTLTAYGQNDSSIEVYKYKERVVLNNREGTCGAEVEMIFGSDEDYVDPEVAPPKKKKSTVNTLVSHFVNNRQSVMGKRYTSKDLTILRSTMKALKDSGLTDFTIMQMTSKFFSVERWRESEYTVLLFAKKDIQAQLLAEIDSAIDTDDPVLQLMLNDFDRGDLDIPWDRRHDSALKKAVVMRGTDVCYRYPEVVSALAHMYPGDFLNENFVNSLTALNSLVRIITGAESGEVEQVLPSLQDLVLPDELIHGNKKMLRPMADSLVEAVYNYRRTPHGKRS